MSTEHHELTSAELPSMTHTMQQGIAGSTGCMCAGAVGRDTNTIGSTDTRQEPDWAATADRAKAASQKVLDDARVDPALLQVSMGPQTCTLTLTARQFGMIVRAAVVHLKQQHPNPEQHEPAASIIAALSVVADVCDEYQHHRIEQTAIGLRE